MSEVKLANEIQEKFIALKKEIGKVIIGQDEVVNTLLTAIFCKGHCLLVGVPGLAKTLLIQTISNTLDMGFNRIQFTPDLMPSDILGAETLDSNREFKFIQGPIFSNIVLADEINRTPPKTQSALLESMQEKSVTIAGKRYKLDEPFFVLATQNPIEQEGTYPLPEAQLDRFMFMITLSYPSFKTEMEVVKRGKVDSKSIEKIISKKKLLKYQELISEVPVPDNVVEYAVKLVHKTRPESEFAPEVTKQFLEWGAGPRASQFLIAGAKCHALLNGKYSPDVEDVKAVALPTLRHRIIKNFKAEAEGLKESDIISKLL